MRRNRESITARDVLACISGFVIAVTIPCMLITWLRMRRVDSANLSLLCQIEQLLNIFAGLEIPALILCAPFGLLFSVLVFMFARDLRSPSQSVMITAGMVAGVVSAFFNIPGYLALDALRPLESCASQNPVLTGVRGLGLFISAGASGGGWIGWQVFRFQNPHTPSIPNFSLRNLTLFILAIGALLAVFAPETA